MVNGKNAGGKVGMAYFKALRDAAPELMAIATGKTVAATLKDKFTESFGRRGKQNSAN
jgi:hypothetical protein